MFRVKKILVVTICTKTDHKSEFNEKKWKFLILIAKLLIPQSIKKFGHKMLKLYHKALKSFFSHIYNNSLFES